jgi:hypothetical protein
MGGHTERSAFQQGASQAFIRVMRARRPDLLWSVAKPREVGKLVTLPHNLHAPINGEPLAA